jgi:beta-mannosidase
MLRVLLTAITFFCSFLVIAQNEERSLSAENWTFRKSNEEKKHPAKVPGTIHTDLFRNKLIPDPFFGNNEQSLQWIEKEEWTYECSFLVSKNELSKTNISLQFQGLDTYAEAYLNGQKILDADNMFRTWEADVKTKLKQGRNYLRVVFKPAAEIAHVAAKALSYTLPGEEKVFVRKAQYHFGWDWGPRFVTCGIWKDVKLLFFDEAKLKAVSTSQSFLNDTVMLTVECFLKNFTAKNYAAVAELSGHGFTVASRKIIAAKDSVAEFKIIIPKPKRWWCKGLGNPDLYTLSVRLLKNNQVVETYSAQIGIREVELIQKNDTAGKSFYFLLNKIPVFIKGANIIPPHSFITETTEKDYETIIENALDANMNMLRVWGGGIYADDFFYKLCNEKGIMVWQDLMFACAMYPGDEKFFKNVEEEVNHQIQRLNNHPSLVLWCGNNESDEGWHNWGWQTQYQYSKEDSAKIYNDYQKLFHELIPQLLYKNKVQVPYHPSSPATGWGRKESYLKGDVHYWGVWWGMESFENYKNKVGRFVSEYGFQSFPDYENFSKFLSPSDMNFDSEAFKNHQKHPTGFQTIDEYLKRDFIRPETFENYAYVTQLLQAGGIRTAIEAHRKSKPYCMGTLFWQLNDCWPVVSWSSIDFYGTPKALHYAVKNAFKDFLIVGDENENEVFAYIVSDDQDAIKGELIASVFDFYGHLLYSDTIVLGIEGNSSAMYWKIEKASIDKMISERSEILIYYKLISDNQILAEQKQYLVKPKDLKLKKPEINIERITDNQIKVTSEKYLAKDLKLSAENIIFSENYFDLLPGESKMVFLKTPLTLNNEIKVKTLFDTLSR